MNMEQQRRTRGVLAVTTTVVLALGVGACGSDDPSSDDEAPNDSGHAVTSATTEHSTVHTSHESIPPTSEHAGHDTATTAVAADAVASPAFCDAFVELDLAFAAAPGDDPDAIGPYIEAEIVPRLETVRANLPDDAADEVTVMADAVEAVATTGDFSAFETPEFAAAAGFVYPYVGTACELQTVDVLARDYAFGGVPEQVEAGPTVFLLHNESEAGEAHEIAFARVNDDVDLTVDELLALPLEEAESMVEISGGVFAMPGAASGAIVDLTPGRWIYVCFIPVGSVDGAEGDGPPHFVEGMSGELVVT